MLRYIEKKTDHTNDGPAWIGTVTESKSGRTIYFNGKEFRRGSGGSGNYFEVTTRDEYWISNVKKNGADRHWSGSGKVQIERCVVDEYIQLVEANKLDTEKLEITDDILKNHIESKHKI